MKTLFKNSTKVLLLSLISLAFVACSDSDDEGYGTNPAFVGHWKKDPATATSSSALRATSNVTEDFCGNFDVQNDSVTGALSIDLGMQKITTRGALLDMQILNSSNNGDIYTDIGFIGVSGLITFNENANSALVNPPNLAKVSTDTTVDVSHQATLVNSNTLQISTVITQSVAGKVTKTDNSNNYTLQRVSDSAFRNYKAQALRCLHCTASPLAKDCNAPVASDEDNAKNSSSTNTVLLKK